MHREVDESNIENAWKYITSNSEIRKIISSINAPLPLRVITIRYIALHNAYV